MQWTRRTDAVLYRLRGSFSGYANVTEPDREPRLAGRFLRGELDPAALAPEVQHELVEELIRGKVVLFTADPDDPEASSVLRAP